MPDISERSLLYSLKPVGIGTAQVESLGGYVARLAEAHNVSVGDLVGREPLCTARNGLYRRTAIFRLTRPRAHVFHAAAHDINGLSQRARKWIRVFENATNRQDICALTMVPLAKAVSDMLLFRKRRAWCPSCYLEDQKSGLVHERLLWAIKVVAICPFHLRPLEEDCPFCDRQQAPLGVRSRPGHCSACRSWLGEPTSQATTTLGNRIHTDFRHEIYQAKYLPRAVLRGAFPLQDSELIFGSASSVSQRGIDRPSPTLLTLVCRPLGPGWMLPCFLASIRSCACALT